MNSNFFITGGYSKVDGGFSLTSKAVAASGIDNAPFSFRADDGVWQGSFWSGPTSRPSEEFKADGSYFFNTGEVSHELKFGGRLREFDRESGFGWALTLKAVLGLARSERHQESHRRRSAFGHSVG